MNRKDFKAEGSIVGGKFKAVISTDSVDRDGEVMVPAGMNAKDYERNPVLLWNHDPSQPIGKSTSLKREDSSIVAEFEFAPRPADYVGDWFPDYVRGLVAAGVVKAVSIGFMPLDGGARVAAIRNRLENPLWREVMRHVAEAREGDKGAVRPKKGQR